MLIDNDNPISKLRQSSFISEKPGYLSEKFKTLTSFNYRRAEFFLLKFCTRFRLTNVCESMCGFFLFYLDLSVSA